jgi:hypothetical protein
MILHLTTFEKSSNLGTPQYKREKRLKTIGFQPFFTFILRGP